MPGFGACRIDQMAQKWKDFADCSAISPSLAITTAKASAKQFRVKLIKYLADICNFQCYARDPGSHELTELSIVVCLTLVYSSFVPVKVCRICAESTKILRRIWKLRVHKLQF